jgi:hypothetical protein
LWLSCGQAKESHKAKEKILNDTHDARRGLLMRQFNIECRLRTKIPTMNFSSARHCATQNDETIHILLSNYPTSRFN